jgi:replicative DNA helicase
MTDNNFNKLGNQFQQSLIKSIIEDPKYGDQIIEVLDSKYFDNSSFKYIVQIIKEHTETYRKIPNYVTIKQKISEDTSSNPLAGKLHTDTIREIENLEEVTLGATYVKDTAMNFCKQQNLVKTLKKVDVIVNNGEFQNYEKIQEMIVEAMQVGTSDDDIVDISDDLESALEKDTRTPIATGISGLDELLRGGLGHGELGMVIAPTGVGKSTILTKFANTAVNLGFKVVQIFFEDRESEIRKKHYTIWSGKPSGWQTESQENKDYVLSKVREVTTSPNFGQLKLIKMESDRTTVGEIRRKLRKLESQGFSPDLLIIDYIDCVSSDRGVFGEEWKGEGSVIRAVESMCSELNLAVWTASQGNRNSISADVVNIDDMGGSIKKAQSAHVIISIAKSLEQKENKTANVTLVKSRIGRDGVNFANCKFDNEYLEIDVTEQETLLGHQTRRKEEGTKRAAEIYKRTHGIQ